MSGRARLFTAYFVTTQVALSYFGLAISRRFRRPAAIARLTLEKHRKNFGGPMAPPPERLPLEAAVDIPEPPPIDEHDEE